MVPGGTTRDLTYQMVMPSTPGTYNNSAIAHVNEFQIDTTQSVTDNVPEPASVTIPPPDIRLQRPTAATSRRDKSVRLTRSPRPIPVLPRPAPRFQ